MSRLGRIETRPDLGIWGLRPRQEQDWYQRKNNTETEKVTSIVFKISSWNSKKKCIIKILTIIFIFCCFASYFERFKKKTTQTTTLLHKIEEARLTGNKRVCHKQSEMRLSPLCHCSSGSVSTSPDQKPRARDQTSLECCNAAPKSFSVDLLTRHVIYFLSVCLLIPSLLFSFL